MGGYRSISNEAIDWPLNPAVSGRGCQIFFFFLLLCVTLFCAVGKGCRSHASGCPRISVHQASHPGTVQIMCDIFVLLLNFRITMFLWSMWGPLGNTFPLIELIKVNESNCQLILIQQHYLGETAVTLPQMYCHGSLVEDDLKPILRICLLDPSFPAFVEKVEGELRKLSEEWGITTTAEGSGVKSVQCVRSYWVCVGSACWWSVSRRIASAEISFHSNCYCYKRGWLESY